MFWVIVLLEDQGTTQTQCCCWMLEVLFKILTKPVSMMRFPSPDTLKHPHSIVLPPLCFTMGTVFFELFTLSYAQFSVVWRCILQWSGVFLGLQPRSSSLCRVLETGFFDLAKSFTVVFRCTSHCFSFQGFWNLSLPSVSLLCFFVLSVFEFLGPILDTWKRCDNFVYPSPASWASTILFLESKLIFWF